MKRILFIAILLATVLFNARAEYDYLYNDLPFEMPLLSKPRIPNNTALISDFGARGNGSDLCTAAFAKAIAALGEKGGGRLIVPCGVWLTGPIVLKDNIELHIQSGGIILFSPDKSLYPLVETSFEGYDNTRRCQSPISAKGAKNIAITGNGAIDGNGEVWRPLKREKVNESTWNRITSQGGVYKRPTYWFPSAQALKGDTISDMNVPRKLTTELEWQSVKDFLRPVMISLIDCENILLQGVVFQNSPAWNIHPLKCRNLIVDNIVVRNPSYAQNGDGIDIESCQNVIVVNSLFDVGDDAICIKSGKDEDGRRRAMPTENVVINGCTVFRGHGGFVVGSEMSGGVKNILVEESKFIGTDVGLRFKSRRGRGGIVENIYVRNVAMTDILTEPLLFDLFYGGRSAVEVLQTGTEEVAGKEIPSIDETTPAFRNIYVKNVSCENARRALFFNGIPEMPITNINIENFYVRSKIGGVLRYSSDITLKNVTIRSDDQSDLNVESCERISVDGFTGKLVRK